MPSSLNARSPGSTGRSRATSPRAGLSRRAGGGRDDNRRGGGRRRGCRSIKRRARNPAAASEKLGGHRARLLVPGDLRRYGLFVALFSCWRAACTFGFAAHVTTLATIVRRTPPTRVAQRCAYAFACDVLRCFPHARQRAKSDACFTFHAWMSAAIFVHLPRSALIVETSWSSAVMIWLPGSLARTAGRALAPADTATATVTAVSRMAISFMELLSESPRLKHGRPRKSTRFSLRRRGRHVRARPTAACRREDERPKIVMAGEAGRIFGRSAPNGIRTRASALKGPRPGPLVDGGRVGPEYRRGGRAPGRGGRRIPILCAMSRRVDADRLERLQLVTDAALAHLELEELLRELLYGVKEIIEVDTCAVLLLDEDTDELVARAAIGIEEEVEQGVRIPVGSGFAGRVAAGREPVVLSDVDHAEVLNPILREKGIKSLLGVALLIEGQPIGVLHVGTLLHYDFDRSDVDLLQVVADRVSIAIEHARAFEAERRARERLERVQVVTDTALAHLELEELLWEVLARIRPVLEVDTAAILLLDEETNELVERAALGIEEEVGVRIPVGGGFAGTVAATRHPLILPDVNSTNVLNPILIQKGIKSLLGVPLVARGEVVGVLHVGKLVHHEFTTDDRSEERRV